MSFLLPRLLLASVAVFIAAPFFFGWLLNGLVILVGGQIFFVLWFLPLLYCLFRSIPGVKS